MQDSRVLPKAQTDTSVWLDVFAKDQFGNLTSARVAISDDAPRAWVTGEDGTVWSNFTGEDPALEAESSYELSQKVSGLWDNAPTNVYGDSDPVTDGVQAFRKHGEVDVKDDAPAIEWYAIDLAASDYSILHNGTSLNPVGKTVIVTYTALDQEGNPIVGLPVKFFRTGPDALQDGNGQWNDQDTDRNGVVRYVFQGAKAGKAVVTAMALDERGNAVEASEQGTTITFGTPAAAISPKLSGASNGSKADVLTVRATKANGAVVRLYKVVNGTRKLVATGKLNWLGAKKFLVKDANGTKATRYVAVVSKTADTKAGTSNTTTVR
jgi:hypothetical protein